MERGAQGIPVMRNGVGHSDKVNMEAVLVNCGQMILLVVLGWIGAVVAGSEMDGAEAIVAGAMSEAPSYRGLRCLAHQAADRRIRGEGLGPHPEERCSLTERFRFLR